MYGFLRIEPDLVFFAAAILVDMEKLSQIFVFHEIPNALFFNDKPIIMRIELKNTHKFNSIGEYRWLELKNNGFIALWGALASIGIPAFRWRMPTSLDYRHP